MCLWACRHVHTRFARVCVHTEMWENDFAKLVEKYQTGLKMKKSAFRSKNEAKEVFAHFRQELSDTRKSVALRIKHGVCKERQSRISPPPLMLPKYIQSAYKLPVCKFVHPGPRLFQLLH